MEWLWAGCSHQGWNWEKVPVWHLDTFPCFPSIPLSTPSSFLPFLVSEVPLQIQCGECCEFLSVSRCSPDDKQFLEHWKSCCLVIVLLQKFEIWGMHCDPCWPCDIPILYFREKKWWYGFESAKNLPLWYTFLLPALVHAHVLMSTSSIICYWPNNGDTLQPGW